MLPSRVAIYVFLVYTLRKFLREHPVKKSKRRPIVRKYLVLVLVRAGTFDTAHNACCFPARDTTQRRSVVEVCRSEG